MDTYILLFRGINVGGKNILPMKDLKSMLEEEGYREVKTYIQSGNVVLSGQSVKTAAIADKIKAAFGFKPEILAIAKKKFEKNISRCPFAEKDGKRLHYFFCTKQPTFNSGKAESLAANDESYKLIGDVFYLHAPSGIGRSKLAGNIEACLGVPATGRNQNTVLKLKEMTDI